MSASAFFNRQPLYLRPDPSRVVVRPFRPAAEGHAGGPQPDRQETRRPYRGPGARDGCRHDRENPPRGGPAGNFEGRHRNLLAKFEARAAEMEGALTNHAAFHALSAS